MVRHIQRGEAVACIFVQFRGKHMEAYFFSDPFNFGHRVQTWLVAALSILQRLYALR